MSNGGGPAKSTFCGESGGTSRPNVASNIHCDLVAERDCKDTININFLLAIFANNSFCKVEVEK